jgi:hypothetical protein
MQSQPPATGIQVHTSFFPLSFFLYFCSPTIVIDNQPFQTKWGSTFFPVPPGQHLVKIFFRYLWIKECGANSVMLTVPPGQVASIKYNMPPFIYAQGSITPG